ncbi:SGNH/GDSL hydrolase family protein [Nocardiopsis sp. CNT-189]|uniref:SGNH/GDSL hydrolase family protein n=1 Tax=Nocardiopsis oceanisediminis TaxID=2816862 RepID=UPI003B2A0921
MRFGRATALAAAVALAAAGCTAGPEAAGGSGGSPGTGERYYLSLGDSLSVGIQPDGEGGHEETSDGYTDVLFRSLHDGDPSLRHERMGCAGETSTTFISGGLEACGERYGGESQLVWAEDFLERNRGRVDLVTVDIGGNNFLGCVGLEAAAGPGQEVDVDRQCVRDGLDRLEEEAPEIASRLRAAAGPDVRIVGMNYYNPFLAALLLEDPVDLEGKGGPRELADYSTEVLAEVNGVLRTAYTDAGFEVADAAEAFGTGDSEVPEGSETGLPANVQAVCDYTWMCDAAAGPDIHTNRAGAQRLAGAFEPLVEAG